MFGTHPQGCLMHLHCVIEHPLQILCILYLLVIIPCPRQLCSMPQGSLSVIHSGSASEGAIQSDRSRRPTDPKWTTDQEVAFADGFPALIISEVTMVARFRTFLFRGILTGVLMKSEPCAHTKCTILLTSRYCSLPFHRNSFWLWSSPLQNLFLVFCL